MPVISYLLSKLTFAYIAEMVAIHGIKHVAVSTLKNIPTLPQRIKSFLSGHVEVPINNHLQSAIVKAQWLSAQVFIKEMHKVDKLKNSYLNVNHSVNEIIISIEKETYLFNDQLIDDFEIETLLSSNDSNNYLNDLKEKISELFLIELDKCTGDIKKMADYQLLKKYIKNGWTEKKLDWFELMVVFFNQLLSGDNNIARDTFQNQVLSKICIKFNDFETYILASHKIGFEIIKKIQGEFVEIKSGISQINSELIRNSKILEEIHGHISNPIDLDLFSKFEAFNKKIEKLKIEIKKIYTKIIKTKGFLKTELEEKILIRFKKDLDSIEDLFTKKIKN